MISPAMPVTQGHAAASRLHGEAAAVACVGEAGGVMSNTPPSNVQTYAGVDTIHIGYCVRWGEGWESIRATIEAAKAKAGDDEADHRDKYVTICGQLFEVMPRGAGEGVYMAFVLRSPRFTLLIADRDEPSGETPNMRIEVGSTACLHCGSLEGLRVSVQSFVRSLPCEVEAEKISRVDLFADVAVPVSQFVERFNAGHYITRAVKAAEYGVFRDGREFTGFTLGAGETRLRVYDKLRELANDEAKRQTWSALEWGDDVPASVTRVEFQLRREACKKNGMDSLDDLQRNAARVAGHLGRDWFRLAHGAFDLNHRKRAATAECWSSAVEAMETWNHTGKEPRLFYERGRVPVDQLYAQVAGLLETISAIRGYDVSSGADLIDATMPGLLAYMQAEKLDVYNRVSEKRLKFESRTPVEPVIWDRRSNRV